jgi:hypothetical protein
VFLALKVFDHKHAGVREATKAVILSLMVLHGDDTVLQSINDQISDRQFNEYRSKYASIMKKSVL